MDQNRRDMRREAARAFLESLDKLEETLQEQALNSSTAVANGATADEPFGYQGQDKPTASSLKPETTTPKRPPPDSLTSEPPVAKVPPPSPVSTSTTTTISVPQAGSTVPKEQPKKTQPKTPSRPEMGISLAELEQAIADIDQFMQSRNTPKQD